MWRTFRLWLNNTAHSGSADFYKILRGILVSLIGVLVNVDISVNVNGSIKHYRIHKELRG